MSVGYSGTPLRRKLGIVDDQRRAFVADPPEFRPLLGDPVQARSDFRSRIDLGVLFVTSAADLARRLGPGSRSIFPDGALWIAWPKRASGVPTDVTEDVVRRCGLDLGLVDIKVCAIDETWSGLKLVWRKENRG